MKPIAGFSEETSGVSPVIGVVLLVSITVVLASAVGVFVLEFERNPDSTEPNFVPETSFNKSLEGDGQTLTIEHESGKRLEPDELTVRITGAETNTSTDVTYSGNVLETQVDGTFGAGKSVTLNRSVFEKAGGGAITGNEYLLLENATVRIVWENPEADQTESYTIYTCEVEYPNCNRAG